MLAGLVAGVLIVPLLMVYALVYDRESQSEQAQSQVTAGWGGPQTITGPVLVVPYTYRTTETETVDGRSVQRSRTVRSELFISPSEQTIRSQLDPQERGYAIYSSVVYDSRHSGSAVFDVPDGLDRLGVEIEELLPDQAELRFGVSNPRGLTDGSSVSIDGEAAQLLPGNGPNATGGSGFSTEVAWSGEEQLSVEWDYGIRGSQSLSLVPRGGDTRWEVTSQWPHLSFTGVLPDERSEDTEPATATYTGITNLSLGERLVNTSDFSAAPMAAVEVEAYAEPVRAVPGGTTIASIGFVDPVDLYSQVDRAVKYGFLFIGFTFAAFLMFDIVGGARVAAAEYLLTGAGLILFFVMLLAFAEVIGFAWAYVVAAGAIIGLLTTYSAAVLGTWKRASFIGAMLAGLYGLLYVLLNLETYSLVIGSLLLFAALAGIMYATRRVEWSSVGREEDETEGFAAS
ncbi:Inner membrane protein CreD [Aurantiacibacter gangjinensis]|nr:Inner membrane protein CreD [Aurantiacibacter gangjinensis]